VKILVIGGTRFIGPVVARKLLARGHEVTLFHRGQTDLDPPLEVRHVYGDRRALAERASELEALRAEVVLDTTLRTEDEARSTVEAFGGRVRSLVALSSIDVYRAFERLYGMAPGRPDPVPLDEGAPLRATRYPRRPRARDHQDWRHDYDKILVEDVLRAQAAIPTTILRLPYVWGPGDYRRRLAPYLEPMEAGSQTLALSRAMAGWRSTRGYVDNVADAIVLALLEPQNESHRLFNVGELEALTEAEWVDEIGRATGWSGRLLVREGEAGGPMSWNQDLIVDTTRIRRELGYAESVDRTEALNRTIEWERRRTC